jgi:uncharacterized protein
MNRWSRWFAGIVALFVLCVAGIAHAFEVPTHQGAVTDTSGTLSADDDRILEERIAAYRGRSGNEIAVLVIPSLEGETIEDVAYRTFNTWGVGKHGLDNGVLLVIAMKEHRTRIETGKGIGHLLTDVQSAHILDGTLAPRLRRNQFREGIAATLDAIEAALGGGAGRPSTPVRPPSPAAGSMLAGMLGVFAFFGLIVGLIVLAARRVGRRGGVGGGGSYDGSSWSSSSSFDSGGGSSSGGGGDFGGGSSGGGGASSGW